MHQIIHSDLKKKKKKIFMMCQHLESSLLGKAEEQSF